MVCRNEVQRWDMEIECGDDFTSVAERVAWDEIDSWVSVEQAYPFPADFICFPCTRSEYDSLWHPVLLFNALKTPSRTFCS